MELLGMYDAGLREFGARVKAVDASQWGSPSPCSEWSVSDLVDHVVEEHRWVPPLMHGHDLAAAGKIVESTTPLAEDRSSADRAAEWDDVARASSEAVNEPGALDRTVSLSRGPTPAPQYLGEMIFDLIVHGWDLGKAIGYQGEFPADAVEFVYGQVKQMGDLSGSGVFGPPIEVPDSASTMDKLLGATGRNPG
jgi:uncharacterized protein (TIGR03086 family)